jgi:hypothetical protein
MKLNMTAGRHMSLGEFWWGDIPKLSFSLSLKIPTLNPFDLATTPDDDRPHVPAL